jgi:hypothetical protein
MSGDEEAEAVLAALHGVPQIGDTFEYAFAYRSGHRERPERWRVSCFFKRYVPPPLPPDIAELFESIGMGFTPTARGAGPDSVPLVVCRREEAEYVEGVGTCGIIVRVSDVHVTGRVPWSEELLASVRHSAEVLIGEVLR